VDVVALIIALFGLVAVICLVMIVNNLAGLGTAIDAQLDDLNKTLKSIAESLKDR
jgi:Flp pilus assembly pilin Flp